MWNLPGSIVPPLGFVGSPRVHALQKLVMTPVDIVITDINMPFINGLELTKRLRIDFPDIFVIIITGFETFAYAKEALKLGVFDYLLKPIKQQEIQDCVRRAIDTRVLQRESQSKFLLSIELLRQELLEKNFENPMDKSDLARRLQELGLSPLQGPCKAVSIRIENYENIYALPQDSERCSYDVKELAERMLGQNGYIWKYGGEYLHAIVSAPIGIPVILEIQKQAKALHDVSLVISIGMEVPSMEQIHSSAVQAWELQKRYGILSHDCIIDSSTPAIIQIATEDISEYEQTLYRNLYEGNADECYILLETILDGISIEEKKTEIMRLLFHFSDIVSKMESQHIITSASLDFDSSVERIMHEKHTGGQCAILKSVVANICQELIQTGTNDSLNRKLLNYIEENYTNSQLSLTMLGDNFQMSPAYLCSIFKRMNKQTFSEYLTNRRMEQACRLLRQTNLKSYEVCSAVGITNAQYFCARFKKYYGITPKEYRNKAIPEQ